VLKDNKWRIIEKLYKDVNIGTVIILNTLERWDINSGRMMQEPPRKYTKPTYTKNCLIEDPRLDGK